jgi:hypothetical protein
MWDSILVEATLIRLNSSGAPTASNHSPKGNTMPWYDYLACFCAGLFLANAVPHFVYGICGDRFPTPFSKPPGKGLSSPLVNVLWGLLNLIIGTALFRVGQVWSGGNLTLAIFFAGVAAISVMLSINFATKHAQ